jgi:cysteinyl-tRNA synthetase
MAIKYLGERFDIHCGGADHVNIHHTNELAQSEAATGKKPWVRFWLHNAFLNIAGGKKMAKSDDNFLTLDNAFIKKGINPLAYRYAALQVHYRKPMEYSEKAMENARKGLKHLYNQVSALGVDEGEINAQFKNKFLSAINDDLNTPQALAVTQELLKSEISDKDKWATVQDFDKVLGLLWKEEGLIPDKILKLAEERWSAKKAMNWEASDKLRKEIEKNGYVIMDAADKYFIIKK